MSPVDTTNPLHRRAWRFMVVLSMFVSSLTLLTSAILYTKIQDSRKESTYKICKSIELLKKDTRDTLISFGVKRKELPRRTDGTVVFAPVNTNCRAVSKNLVKTGGK